MWTVISNKKSQVPANFQLQTQEIYPYTINEGQCSAKFLHFSHFFNQESGESSKQSDTAAVRTHLRVLHRKEMKFVMSKCVYLYDYIYCLKKSDHKTI